jgi:guanylate kinase
VIKPGLAVVISSPSGTGKTTISHQLIERFHNYQYSISATTRPVRGNEQNGVDYIFMSPAEFQKAKENNEFIETAEYIGHWYGTPKKPLVEAIESGKIILLDIDIQGGRSIKQELPEAITIFLIPPDLHELEMRLRGRRTENDASIKKRLQKAAEELKAWNEYDFVVVNDELSRAVEAVTNIVRVEQMKTLRLNDKKYWEKKLSDLLGLA